MEFNSIELVDKLCHEPEIDRFFHSAYLPLIQQKLGLDNSTSLERDASYYGPALKNYVKFSPSSPKQHLDMWSLGYNRNKSNKVYSDVQKMAYDRFRDKLRVDYRYLPGRAARNLLTSLREDKRLNRSNVAVKVNPAFENPASYKKSLKDLLFIYNSQCPSRLRFPIEVPSENMLEFSEYLVGRKYRVGRDYSLRKLAELDIAGRSLKRSKRDTDKPHGLSYYVKSAFRGNFTNAVGLCAGSDYSYYFETMTPPPHLEHTDPYSKEFENAFVSALSDYFHRVNNISNKEMKRLYCPVYHMGVTERQMGLRSDKHSDGEARGAVHFHGVTAYHHRNDAELPYFKLLQSMRFLSCLDKYGFEVLSKAGRAARDRHDPDFDKCWRYFKAHKYEAIIGQVSFTDGKLVDFRNFDFVDGKKAFWFLSPVHFERISNPEKSIDPVCAYFSKYFGDEKPGKEIGGLAGTVVNTLLHISDAAKGKSLLSHSEKMRLKAKEENLYRRRFFSSVGLRITRDDVTETAALSFDQYGMDVFRVSLNDPDFVSTSGIFTIMQPSKLGGRRVYERFDDASHVHKLTYDREKKEVDLKLNGFLENSLDRSQGGVIYSLNSKQERAAQRGRVHIGETVRSLFFSNPLFSKGIKERLMSSHVICAKMERITAESPFSADTSPLYSEWLRMVYRQLPPGYNPSGALKDLLRSP